MMVVVRRMLTEDFPALARIEATSDENFWNEDTFGQHLCMSRSNGLVVWDSMAPVAFVAFESMPRTSYLQIWNLVVEPRFRKKGIGRLLVSRLIERVPSEFDGIRFNVRESNVEAQLFLRQLGFWCDCIALDYFLDFTV